MAIMRREQLLTKLMAADHLPSLPVVVAPLLNYLQRPIDDLQINEVTRLISQDESLAAQCLHFANSPLFGRWQQVDSVRGAIISLGMQRMRDIVTGCCLVNLAPKNCPIDPTVFWEHGLGVALAARYFARAIGFPDPDKAYLAGLLHDFGVVMSYWVAPQEYAEAFRKALSGHIPLIEAEEQLLGIGHAEVGRILAEKWHMPSDLVQVIAWHHDVREVKEHKALVALVALADLLCRMSAVGYGYPEDREIDFQQEPAFQILIEECKDLASFDWERFTLEMEAHMTEVKRLVGVVYRRS
ncbi:MAG TPA: HDOD domain-containing protein [Terriglobales bacterium]|nr:HDOD domain-containing protein [Terriglobales bacterium]